MVKVMMKNKHYVIWLCVASAVLGGKNLLHASDALPRRVAPVGVLNDESDEVCYVTVCFQLLEAIRMRLGTQFEQVLGKEGLLDGYKKTITRLQTWPSQAPFAVQKLVVDPQSFVHAFITASPVRAECRITEFVTSAGEKMQARDLIALRRLGRRGDPCEVMVAVEHELDAQYKKLQQENPFCWILDRKDESQRRKLFLSLQSVLEASANGACNLDLVIPDVTSAPSITFVHADTHVYAIENDSCPPAETPFVLYKKTDNSVDSYQLLAAVYRTPTFAAQQYPVYKRGKAGIEVFLHTVALVRYDENWFLCNDEHIIPCPEKEMVKAWLKPAASLSYEGQALDDISPQSKCVRPLLLVYERVDKKGTS